MFIILTRSVKSKQKKSEFFFLFPPPFIMEKHYILVIFVIKVSSGFLLCVIMERKLPHIVTT